MLPEHSNSESIVGGGERSARAILFSSMQIYTVYLLKVHFTVIVIISFTRTRPYVDVDLTVAPGGDILTDK